MLLLLRKINRGKRRLTVDFSILEECANNILWFIAGLYSGRIANCTVTVPVPVDESGNSLTNESILTHRNKRSIEEQNLHYKLEIEGEAVVLELVPNDDFISPHLVVERRAKKMRTRKIIGDNYLLGNRVRRDYLTWGIKLGTQKMSVWETLLEEILKSHSGRRKVSSWYQLRITICYQDDLS